MGFKSDIEIAQEAKMKVINEVADSIGIPDKYVENYGKYKAKIDYRYYTDELEGRKDAKLVLVTAINPTPAGEGKTTTTIGLADAMNRLGKKNNGCFKRAVAWSGVRCEGRSSRRRICTGCSDGGH